MNEEEFLNLKRMYLIDQKTGLIRDGLTMNQYADILNSEDEEELDRRLRLIMGDDAIKHIDISEYIEEVTDIGENEEEE